MGTAYGDGSAAPLEVEIYRGLAGIEQVLNDVMGLTKPNRNSCRHSAG